MADNTVRGRLALVTGASGGIGAACARRLAQMECDLALTYGSSKEAMDALIAELATENSQAKARKIRITAHQADLASTEATVQLCKDVQSEHGRAVDILVSNAGYGKRIREIWDIPLAEYEHTMAVNIRAPFLLAQGVAQGMRDQRWGRIIFISSISALGGGINGCHYAASKGALGGLMKNLSTTLAPYNISVNDVAPAMVGQTGMIKDENTVPGLVESIPLKRLCTPEEVANCVEMYAKSGFVTGQSLLISGGLK